MTGAPTSQRHLTASRPTSRQPNRRARSTFSYSRRPPRALESDRQAPRHYLECHAWRQPCPRRSQFHLRGWHPRPPAGQATSEKSP